MTYRCARTVYFEIALCPYSFEYCSTTSSPRSSRFSLWRCYSDMGILASVLGIPIPKTLVIWASPSHITLAFWVRVRVRGDAHIIRVLGMGMPKTRGCPLISLWQRRRERSSLLENKRTLGGGCIVLFLWFVWESWCVHWSKNHWVPYSLFWIRDYALPTLNIDPLTAGWIRLSVG